MKLKEKIKKRFIRKNEEMSKRIINNKESEDKTEKKEFEIIINDIDTFALYFKDRELPYILIKTSDFPFMLNNPDIEWIEMNKNNFDYYHEFSRFEYMFDELQRQYEKEKFERKTENDYLIDYLENSNSGYSKIINKMKEFEEIYSYKFYEDIRYKEGSISHCGYPDYMWQSGAERNIYIVSSNT